MNCSQESPAFRRGEYVNEPASQYKVAYSAEALKELYSITGGYPYFIQAYGRHCWDVATESPIGMDDVEAVKPRALDELSRSFYEPRFERALPSEKEYLMAIAEHGESASTSDVADTLGKKLQDVGQYRAGLLDKGLIYVPERGKVAFTVPRMAQYLLSRND